MAGTISGAASLENLAGLPRARDDVGIVDPPGTRTGRAPGSRSESLQQLRPLPRTCSGSTFSEHPQGARHRRHARRGPSRRRPGDHHPGASRLRWRRSAGSIRRSAGTPDERERGSAGGPCSPSASKRCARVRRAGAAGALTVRGHAGFWNHALIDSGTGHARLGGWDVSGHGWPGRCRPGAPRPASLVIRRRPTVPRRCTCGGSCRSAPARWWPPR